jgi:hypothetical protein
VVRPTTCALAGLALVALAACGDSEPHARVTVAIRVSRAAEGQKRIVTSFTLRCGPVGGDLPLARRVCRDIARHPVAMLNPHAPLSTCGGMVNGPAVVVRATAARRHGHFAGQPFCGWPGGTALGIYFSAATHDLRTLARVEPRLRCDDDPELLRRPTPWHRVDACLHGRPDY